jgi:hypothetical protein
MLGLFRPNIQALRASRALLLSTSSRQFALKSTRLSHSMSPKRSSTITTSTTSAFATLSTEETVADASNGTKKRAASPPTEDEADYVDESTQSQSQSQPSRKKSRLSIVETQVESQVATSSQARVQPTNRVLPVDIKFPKKAVGSIRIAGWNVTSLASSQKKVRPIYLDELSAHIVRLT